MRIAFVIERFDPAGGGLEHATWQTAHALAEAGQSVTVLARKHMPSEAIEAVEIRAPRVWQPLRIKLFAKRAGAWLAAARREGRIDVSHAWSRVPGADIFHTGEGSHLHYMRATYGSLGSKLRYVSPRHAAQLQIERAIFTAPGLHVQHVSPRIGRQLADRFGLQDEVQHVIPYGVDTERFIPRDEAALRTELDPRGGDAAPRFLLAGSGWRRKGLDTAIAALAAAKHDEARLWVAGGDDARAWRGVAERHGVTERVVFLGSRPDLERVYAASDVLILPTRYDAFGLVCTEAAATGRPVIMSGAAGAADLLAEGSIVVDDPEDIAGFAQAMDALCDGDERERLGQAGLAIASNLSWRAQTEALLELYRRIR